MIDGLLPAISDIDYHADTTSLSSTGARKLLACPARFKWERDNPPAPTTKAFDFGKLAHRVILGEGSPIQIVEADNWLTKAAKEQREAARLDGAVPVLRTEYDAAQSMRNAVMAHPVARDIFADGKAELSGYWRDEPTDVLLRFRPDWMTELDGRAACIDLKTTVSAEPQDFSRSVVKFGYGLQAAFYLAGLAAIGIKGARFLFVAVEKAPPYPVAVIELDAEAVTQGAYDMRRAVDLYAECVRTDTWPAYGSGIHTVSLPPWAVRDATQEQANQLISELEGIAHD